MAEPDRCTECGAVLVHFGETGYLCAACLMKRGLDEVHELGKQTAVRRQGRNRKVGNDHEE